MTLQIECDLRQELGSVRDQGRRPTCLAFAASVAHQYAWRHGAPFSVEWLYFHAVRRRGGGPKDGITLEDTMVVLETIGQPEEVVWPYCARIDDLSQWHPPATSAKIFKHGMFGLGESIHPVRGCLDQGIPVVIGLFISRTFRFPDGWTMADNEVILAADAAKPIDLGPGHAVVAVGYGQYQGTPVTLLRNSWGSTWGVDGHAWAYDCYLEPRLVGSFAVNEGEAGVLQSNAPGTNGSVRLG